MSDDLVRRLRSVMVTHSENGTPLGTPFADALCREAADALERRWIPVGEPPKEDGWYWVYYEQPQRNPMPQSYPQEAARFNRGQWNSALRDVTHWQPLPPPPAKREGT